MKQTSSGKKIKVVLQPWQQHTQGTSINEAHGTFVVNTYRRASLEPEFYDISNNLMLCSAMSSLRLSRGLCKRHVIQLCSVQ